MIPLFALLEGALERGLLYAIVVIAVYITSRIINFDDLSVEGSFGVGGAITAACMANSLPWWGCLPIAMIAGCLSGLATGILHTKLKLNNLISGIIVTTGLFSISLKLASSSIMLTGKSTFISTVPALIILPIIAGALLILVRWFLQTEIGFLLQAVGSNPRMLTNLGKSIDRYKILGLVISNMLTGLAGCLFVQYLGYFSIWTSVGTMIIALTGLILAELLGKGSGINLVVGAIAYQAIITTTFELQIDQDWNKLIAALLLILLLSLKKLSSTHHALQRS